MSNPLKPVLIGAIASGVLIDATAASAADAASLKPAAPIMAEVSGYPEDDDLPAYLSASAAETPPAAQANTVRTQPSVLAPDGPAGLRWSILIGLMLATVFCLGAAFMTGGRHARHH
ncbi:MAG: hypothetical protein AAGB15_05885 [Pseudomonadota bacterium]